jgi:hypothetical protein
MDATLMLVEYAKNNPDDNSVLLSLLEYILSKPLDKPTQIYLRQKSKQKLSSFKEFVDLIPTQDPAYKRYIFRYYSNAMKKIIFNTAAPIISAMIYYNLKNM